MSSLLQFVNRFVGMAAATITVRKGTPPPCTAKVDTTMIPNLASVSVSLPRCLTHFTRFSYLSLFLLFVKLAVP